MTRRPTIIDVAREAGVSKSVVSRVLRGEGRVSPEARKAVLRSARSVGYTPNIVARSLKERVSGVVGVVAADLSHPYYVDVIHGIYEAAAEVSQKVLIVSGHESIGGEEGAIQSLLDFRVAGIIMASTNLPMARIARRVGGVPVAIEGRRDASSKFDVVRSDDAEGGRLIIEHLASLGHRRIAVLEDASPSGRDRQEAFRQALRASGLTGQARFAASSTTFEAGYEATRRLIRKGKPPTAIVCPDDVTAIGALSALRELGLRVPEEVSVTGFDDVALASARHFNLTTVRQERLAIGQTCLRLVHRRAQDSSVDPSRVILPPTLVVRGSTGKTDG